MSRADFEIAGFLEPSYLGDSVYAGHDGFHIKICTNNGYGCENIIALDPQVFEALIQYRDRLSKKHIERTKDNGM